MEYMRASTRIFGGHFYSRSCPMCGHIINFEQPIPLECAIESLTTPFRNVRGWIEFNRSGICQDCQDNRYGKED